jgi:hypothetical protein
MNICVSVYLLLLVLGRVLSPASGTFTITDWRCFIFTDRRFFKISENEHYEKMV